MADNQQATAPVENNQTHQIEIEIQKNHQSEEKQNLRDFSNSADEFNKKPHQVELVKKVQGKKYSPQNSVFEVLSSNNEGDYKAVEVICLEYTFFKVLLGVLCTICTIGIWWVTCSQNNKLYKYFFFSECSLEKASYFLVKAFDGSYELTKRIVINKDVKGKERIGMVSRYLKYFLSKKYNLFKPLDIYLENQKNEEIYQFKYLDDAERQNRMELFGKCLISFNILNFFQFGVYFCTKPVMVTVYLAIFVYFAQSYPLFAINMIWTMSVVIIVMYIFYYYQRKGLQEKVQKTIKIDRVEGVDGKSIQVNSTELVPGDIIRLEPYSDLPCDILVVDGEAFVNESNITGESDPVPKVKLPHNHKKFDYIENIGSVVYEGSKILSSQASLHHQQYQNALGMVIRTGFSTKKGQVIRQSLFMKFKVNRFLKSLTFFQTCCFIIFVICFFINLYWFVNDDELPRGEIALKFGDGFVNLYAPALIVLTNALLITALWRLKRQNIAALHPDLVYATGDIQTVCFDKTGTLTENKIICKGVWTKDTKFVQSENLQQCFTEQVMLQNLLATCHQAQNVRLNTEETQIQIPENDKQNNVKTVTPGEQILGDAIDVQMFGLSQYKFIENHSAQGKETLATVQNINDSSKELKVIKRFEFQSQHASMSVIVQDSQFKQYVYVKGAPEKIKRSCNPSTIPEDFDSIQDQYTINGFRVLVLAYRDWQNVSEEVLENLDRQELEKDLQFLGFLILENPLKFDSEQTINNLKAADVQVKIISGDNNLTVTYTAQQLGVLNDQEYVYLIDHDSYDKKLVVQMLRQGQLTIYNAISTENQDKEIVQFLSEFVSKKPQMSITGKVIEMFEEKVQNSGSLDKQELLQCFKDLILITSVFSRCNPEMKKAVIIQLKAMNIKVAMVGDGANDSLAIQEADIGVSFSTADAALSSPFCTTQQSIDCVEKILLEGRSTMEINYEAAQLYMACMVLKTLITTLQLNFLQQIGDLQLTFSGYYFGYIINMVCMIFIFPTKKLQKEKLQYLMTSSRSIAGAIGRWGLSFSLVAFAHFNLLERNFYGYTHELQKSGELNLKGYVNTNLAYIYLLVNSLIPYTIYVANPVKSVFYHNIPTFLCVNLHIILCVMLFFVDYDTFNKMDFVPLSDEYRGMLFGACIFTFVLQLVWEKFVMPRFAYYQKKTVFDDFNSRKPKVQ